MMTGVVMALASWYVPTVLNCRERLVNTTNPQNDVERGRIFRSDSRFGEKISSFAHRSKPSEVTTKCVSVRVMLGNP